jgi:hypothetical protein
MVSRQQPTRHHIFLLRYVTFLFIFAHGQAQSQQLRNFKQVNEDATAKQKDFIPWANKQAPRIPGSPSKTSSLACSLSNKEQQFWPVYSIGQTTQIKMNHSERTNHPGPLYTHQ